MSYLLAFSFTFILSLAQPLTAEAEDIVLINMPTLRSIKFVNETHGWVVGYRNAFYTSNGGKSWDQKPIDIGLSSKSHLSSRETYAGTIVWADTTTALIRSTEGLVRVTIEAGQIQECKVPRRFNDYMTDMAFADPLQGWSVGTLGQIYQTTDGGMAWQELRKPVSKCLVALQVISPSEVWVVGDETTVLHTTDSGKTWQQKRLLTGVKNKIDLQCVFFLNSTEGWISGIEGAIFHTNDGGETWTRQTTPFSVGCQIGSISMSNSQVGWAVGSCYKSGNYNSFLLHTGDGGLSWTTKYPQVKSGFSTVEALPSGKTWFIGWDSPVLLTTNHGERWEKIKLK